MIYFLGGMLGGMLLMGIICIAVADRMTPEIPEEVIHDPVRWNDDRKMCACGKLWPHD